LYVEREAMWSINGKERQKDVKRRRKDKKKYVSALSKESHFFSRDLQISILDIEPIDVAVQPLTNVRKVLGSNLGRDTKFSNFGEFHVFLEFRFENHCIIPQLRHDMFLTLPSSSHADLPLNAIYGEFNR
jgi:hypothetical protein